MADYRDSGLSAAKWYNANNQKTHRPWCWVRKFEAAKSSGQGCSKWLPILMTDHLASEASLSIRVDHATITVSPGFDQALLLDVVRTLSSQR